MSNKDFLYHFKKAKWWEMLMRLYYIYFELSSILILEAGVHKHEVQKMKRKFNDQWFIIVSRCIYGSTKTWLQVIKRVEKKTL